MSRTALLLAGLLAAAPAAAKAAEPVRIGTTTILEWPDRRPRPVRTIRGATRAA